MSSPTWRQYECGKLSQDQCYSRVSIEFSIDLSEVSRALEHARESLKANHSLLSFIHTLKREADGGLRVFAMSNISQPDYDYLVAKNTIDWSIFDQIFTSAAAGMRKPDLCFYRHVLEVTGCDPTTTAFVDDKAENVLSAKSLGMHGVVYADLDSARRTLRSLVGDPIQRGWDFLWAHAGNHVSLTKTGLEIGDNFAQLLLLEATKQQKLVNLTGIPNHGKVNYFRDQPLLTTSEFPYDLDTTSLSLTVLEHDLGVINSVMDEMLQYRSEDGIILTYFDDARARMDPVVCVNVLTLFHTHNRGSDLQPTFDWVFDVLKHRAYLDGTRYYKTAETFLYFLTRLLDSTSDEAAYALIRPLLEERLQERVGAPGDSLALSMRVVACARVGIRDTLDIQRLLTMQREDGSWGPGELCRYGSSDVTVGNFGLVTALAINAIQTVAVER